MKSTAAGEMPVSVLYVDDEPSLLDIGQLFLERAGDITVHTAEGAEEAIRRIGENNYDAIVSDYQMPGMDGIAFLKHLRSSGNTIPFIIFTGKGREEVVIEALNSGADFYLQKGGDPKAQFAELTNIIRAAVSHKMAEKLAKETEKRLYDIIQFLPDPTFAIDSRGVVIAWNQAIEEMTGIPASDMVGKGNYEYSIPFYGERRPILIDLVSISDEELLHSKYASIRREGDILIAETSLPRPLGRYAILAGKASRLYNEGGDVVGAIETIRDITEQRRFEEALQESEERYRLTLDAANDGIWDWDIASGNAFFSDRWYTMLGYEPGEMPGSYATWRSLVHPGDLERAEGYIQNHIRTGRGSFRLEFRMQAKDGGSKWILARGKIVGRDAEGKPLRLLGTHTDITEQKEAERALEKSERLYRLITENMTETITIMDLSFRFRYVSPSVESLRGYTVDEAVVQSLEDVLAPESLMIAQQTFQEAMEREAAGEPVGVVSLDLETYRKDGSTNWVNNTMTVLRDGDGVATAILIVGRDVTERKNAELEAERNKRLLEAMLDGIPDIVGLQLPDHTIIRYNKAGYEILGLRPEEIQGRRCYEIIGRSSPCELCATSQAILSKKQETVERYVPELGMFMECTSNPVLDKNGEVELVIEILQDITERKEAEEALKNSNERLKTVINSMDAFVYIADMETYELLFVNDYARKIWGDIEGATCWKSLQKDQIGPCSFCTNDRLLDEDGNPAGIYIWQFRNTMNGRWYECRDRAIPWIDGRIVRMEIATDITERKRAEDQLILKDASIDASLNGLVITDLSGRITYANPAFLAMWRSSDQDEAIGRSILSLWTAEEKGREIADAILETGRWSGEVVGKRKDGSEIIVELATSLVRDASGAPIAMMGSCIDITERKLAEEALRMSEEKYRLIAENTADNIWIFDMDFKLRYISPSILMMKGFTVEEALTQAVEEMMTPESYAALLDRFNEEMEREASGTADPERTVSFETEEYCKDGGTILVENSTRLLRDEEGRPVGIIGISRDITKRKEMEWALRSHLDMIEGLFESLPLGVVIIDSGGAILLINRRYEEITGYSPEEIPTVKEWFLRAYPDPAYRNEVLSIWNSDQEEEIRNREFKVTCKDGTVKDIEFHGVFLGDGRIIVTISDITERKQEERALHNANTKLQILSSITRHDILNKIMAIDGYIWLKREKEGDQQDRYLADIERAVKSIERQIEFTRQYEDLGVHVPIWLPLTALIEGVDDGKLPVIRHLCDDIAVYSDPMIEKVFSNLMENTILHAEGASRVEIRCEERDGRLAIIWEDDGPGVPDDQKERIFERGFGKHTGLGLFLSQEILAITGITIAETGEYGKGARFEMLVPERGWRQG